LQAARKLGIVLENFYANNDAATQEIKEQGRRRSARVLLSVPVVVRGVLPDGNKFEDDARTLVVGAHGALLALSIPITNGQPLTLTHKPTRNSLECRTVYIGRPQAGKAEVAIEFLKPSPMFWQIDFPPDGWTVPEN
jgi:hypothetical protein